ncbi:hypothetical protein IMG5_138750 [Ichthyophthirius multifiliis]|uniref:Uncharacterized protein n=1 Tax=Ichthyophthirius multifiliis TaxID=5932 RepID=G0QX72_ICHMU|nr:hypothetical protein IMG5_138750 [Ichthyophthirius multifiliis]EGR30189.1 hypothetical protein IMG5_138750 [Ichthyophthirius multifiliis]|eukprot:XP_004031785.1 hypothetical protein IMG5_138750 [Ichthyophthirius multifiliis]
MKKRQGDIKGFISEMKKVHDDFKKKKVKNVLDEEVPKDDNFKISNVAAPQKPKLKGILNMFQKQYITNTNKFLPNKKQNKDYSQQQYQNGSEGGDKNEDIDNAFYSGS